MKTPISGRAVDRFGEAGEAKRDLAAETDGDDVVLAERVVERRGDETEAGVRLRRRVRRRVWCTCRTGSGWCRRRRKGFDRRRRRHSRKSERRRRRKALAAASAAFVGRNMETTAFLPRSRGAGPGRKSQSRPRRGTREKQ